MVDGLFGTTPRSQRDDLSLGITGVDGMELDAEAPLSAAFGMFIIRC